MSEINNATPTECDPVFTQDSVAPDPSERGPRKLHSDNGRWENTIHGLSSVWQNFLSISRKECVSAFTTAAFYV